MTSIPTIEQLWQELKRRGNAPLQRRVDASHPLDIYVDFVPPGRPGLVAVCAARPPSTRPLRAIDVETGKRDDGRWSWRISLDEPGLLPVFAALCRDIIDFTRDGVSEAQLASVLPSRLEHWRTLFEKEQGGLSVTGLRGLLGELTILECILDDHPSAQAIDTWIGPLGTPQDFQFPDGRRIEVKAVRRDAQRVRINGLGQLDSGQDHLELAVVRVEETGTDAAGAVTVRSVIDRIRSRIALDARALSDFATSLAFAGWKDDPNQGDITVRVVSVDRYEVGLGFPRLTAATVPPGVDDAEYTIVLPSHLRSTIQDPRSD